MITVTSQFLENAQRYGRRLSVRLTIGSTVFSDNDIMRVEREFNADLFRTSMVQINADIKGNHNVLNQNIEVEIAIEGEYISYGIFKIVEVEYDVGKDYTELKAYDPMIEAHKPYRDLSVTYPTTVYGLLEIIASFMGIDVMNNNIPNGSKPIASDRWSNVRGITVRDVLDNIAEVAGGAIVIKNGQLFYKALDEPVQDEFNSVDEETARTMEIGEVIGPIDTLNLTREPQHDNYFYPSQGDSEIVIDNNPIMDDNRAGYAPTIYAQIQGFEYYPVKSDTYGVLHLEPFDIIYAVNLEKNVFTSVVSYNRLVFTTGIVEELEGTIFGSYADEYALTTDEEREFMNVHFLVDKQEGVIEGLVEQTGENSTKITQLRQDVNSISSTVSELGGGNLTPNFIGEYGVESWTFETAGLFPSTSLYPATHVYPLGVNGAIMNAVNVTGASSGTGFLLWHSGKALSDYAQVLGGEKYSLYTRYQGAGGTVFKVREYTSETPANKNAYSKETTLGTTSTKGSWTTLSDSIITEENTKSVVIVIESGASPNDTLTFTDSSFNFGNPKPYATSMTDVSLKADLAYTTATQTAHGFELVSTTVTALEGRVDNAEASLSLQSGQINLRVKKNEIISEINQSPEEIRINASKVNLVGYVTISNLTDGSTTISGSNITTGTINANNVTITNINASNITAGTLSASRIGASTITAEKLSITSLSAITSDLGSITGGSLSIGGRFTVNSSGYLTATGATISGAITATSGSFTGNIYASSGRIGAVNFTSTNGLTLSGNLSATTVTSTGRMSAQGGMRIRMSGSWYNAEISGNTLVFRKEVV